MPAHDDDLPDWERLLSAECHLQRLVPGAVLVGGSAAAVHARHRVGMDGERFGQLDGVLTGIRQLRRTRPLETEEVEGLRVPTLAEMARIKAWLLATRDTVRDYLDTVVLLERLGEAGVRAALSPFDEIYRQTSNVSPLAEVAERLAAAAPRDIADIDITRYRALRAPWNDWNHVVIRGRAWAEIIARLVLEERR